MDLQLFILLILFLSFLQIAFSFKFHRLHNLRRFYSFRDESTLSESAVPIIESAILNLSVERLKFELEKSSEFHSLNWFSQFCSKSSAKTFEEMHKSLLNEGDKQITSTNGAIEVNFSLSMKALAQSLFNSKNFIVELLTPVVQRIPQENINTITLACIMCENGYSEYTSLKERIVDASYESKDPEKDKVCQSVCSYMDALITESAISSLYMQLQAQNKSNVIECVASMLRNITTDILNKKIDPYMRHFDDIIDESTLPPQKFQDLSNVESTSYTTIDSLDLLERLFVRGLIISKITSAGGYVVPVSSSVTRNRQEMEASRALEELIEDALEISKSIDVLSIAQSIANERLRISKEADYVFNRLRRLSISKPLERISPSITVEELMKNTDSPFFSMKKGKQIPGLNSSDEGMGFNATDDIKNCDDGKDDDFDISVSVGSPRIYVSPDQLDGSEDIRQRVGWQADNSFSDDTDSPARKEDAAGKKQRTAVAVLKPPNFGGGSNRNNHDLGGEGREEWDENRNPVDYNEIPHGNIRTFFDMANRSKIWIRIIATKEEEEPIKPEEDSAVKEKSKSWDSRPRAYVKYACIEATSDRDKEFLYSRWVKYDDAVILFKELEQNMLEDREATFKFRQECEKYGIILEPRRDESSGESPFFGGPVHWM